MTVSTQVIKRTYTANGVNCAWEVDFPLASRQDLHVWITSPDGVTSEVTNFTLNATATSVQYPVTGSELDPLAAGWTITLERQTSLTQEIDLIRQGELDAEVLEQGYDKLTLISQELQTKITDNMSATATNTAALAAESSTRSTVDNTLQANLNAEVAARQSADAALQSTLNGKQAALTTEQLTAVNSGITSALVTQIGSNQSDISSLQTNKLSSSAAASTYLSQTDAAAMYATQAILASGLAGKQDVLTTSQQAAVDSGITSTTVAQVQTNKEDIAALDAELDENREWQKPAEWIDIRSGALANSVYFLVGHSADYSTYPTLPITPSVSNAGTYDIYIDGIKQFSAVASGTETTLTWQTLALTSGWDVTYPTALRTHVVRITPTSSSNNLSALSCGPTTVKGILWMHFTTTTAMNIEQLLNSNGNVYVDRAPVCEAITAVDDELKVTTSISGAFNCLKNLKKVSTLVGPGNTTSSWIYCGYAFARTLIKKIKFKNFYARTGASMFRGCSSLENIESENSTLALDIYSFESCTKLKKLPNSLRILGLSDHAIAYMTSLENTFIDYSSATTATQVSIPGSNTSPMYGLKGLTVSNEAPFSSSSSPQLDVSYTGLDRTALVSLFNSMPTVTDSQVINITGCTGAADLTAGDLAIATNKGWTVTR